jgi:hypothetical protein
VQNSRVRCRLEAQEILALSCNSLGIKAPDVAAGSDDADSKSALRCKPTSSTPEPAP